MPVLPGPCEGVDVRIVGIVHTKNEQRNIARALRSLLPVCDEVLVADMQSADDTRTIAAGLGARILEVPDFGYADPAWSLALEAVEADWVLRIDADELVPPALAERFVAIARDDSADVVDVARLNFMFGAPIRGTGWASDHDRHFFFFKPAHLQSVRPEETRVHTTMRPLAGARVDRLPADDALSVWHFNYTDWAHFVDKLNRYTSIEAGEDAVPGSTDVSTLVREVLSELRFRGRHGRAWRDGYRGIGLVGLMAVYRSLVWLKRRQLQDVGDERSILARYDRIAEALSEGAPAEQAIAGIVRPPADEAESAEPGGQ